MVSFNTLLGRYRLGEWSFEKSMQTTAHEETKKVMREKQGKKITAFGETKSLIDWAEDVRCKVGYSGLKIRIGKGLDAETAISFPPRR